MKILIPTIMYGRHRTFNVFAQGIKNLQIAYPEVEINCLAVGTGDRKIVEKHGFEYHEFPNQPLSEKAQHRLELSKNKADYYLFLGSDDVMDEKLFGYYLERIKQGYDFIAPYDIHYWNRGVLYYSSGYKRGDARFKEPLAVGRCLSNKLLNDFNWELWTEERKIGLDAGVWKKLKEVKNSHFFKSKNIGILLDVKTVENLSRFDRRKHTRIGFPQDYLNPNLIPLLNGL
jgi:hypothetical protein